jgi:hypothetical protein
MLSISCTTLASVEEAGLIKPSSEVIIGFLIVISSFRYHGARSFLPSDIMVLYNFQLMLPLNMYDESLLQGVLKSKYENIPSE